MDRSFCNSQMWRSRTPQWNGTAIDSNNRESVAVVSVKSGRKQASRQADSQSMIAQGWVVTRYGPTQMVLMASCGASSSSHCRGLADY